MLIPDYQIHNILKDFTQRLKNGDRGPGAGGQSESVVNKVAGTIMRRVVDLGEEEARRCSRNARLPRSRRASGERRAVGFQYHTMGTDRCKRLRHLSLENSAQLIERFHSLITPPEAPPSKDKS